VHSSKDKFLPDYDELKLITLSNQISSDYSRILKLIVLPTVNKDHKFRLRELRVLMCLGDTFVDVSAMDLAQELREDPSTITRSIVSLIRDGYIITEENRTDGRSKMIALTTKGKASAKQCSDVLRAFLQNMSTQTEIVSKISNAQIEELKGLSERTSVILKRAKETL